MDIDETLNLNTGKMATQESTDDPDRAASEGSEDLLAEEQHLGEDGLFDADDDFIMEEACESEGEEKQATPGHGTFLDEDVATQVEELPDIEEDPSSSVRPIENEENEDESDTSSVDLIISSQAEVGTSSGFKTAADSEGSSPGKSSVYSLGKTISGITNASGQLVASPILPKAVQRRSRDVNQDDEGNVTDDDDDENLHTVSNQLDEKGMAQYEPTSGDEAGMEVNNSEDLLASTQLLAAGCFSQTESDLSDDEEHADPDEQEADNGEGRKEGDFINAEHEEGARVAPSDGDGRKAEEQPSREVGKDDKLADESSADPKGDAETDHQEHEEEIDAIETDGKILGGEEECLESTLDDNSKKSSPQANQEGECEQLTEEALPVTDTRHGQGGEEESTYEGAEQTATLTIEEASKGDDDDGDAGHKSMVPQSEIRSVEDQISTSEPVMDSDNCSAEDQDPPVEAKSNEDDQRPSGEDLEATKEIPAASEDNSPALKIVLDDEKREHIIDNVPESSADTEVADADDSEANKSDNGLNSGGQSDKCNEVGEGQVGVKKTKKPGNDGSSKRQSRRFVLATISPNASSPLDEAVRGNQKEKAAANRASGKSQPRKQNATAASQKRASTLSVEEASPKTKAAKVNISEKPLGQRPSRSSSAKQVKNPDPDTILPAKSSKAKKSGAVVALVDIEPQLRPLRKSSRQAKPSAILNPSQFEVSPPAKSPEKTARKTTRNKKDEVKADVASKATNRLSDGSSIRADAKKVTSIKQSRKSSEAPAKRKSRVSETQKPQVRKPEKKAGAPVVRPARGRKVEKIESVDIPAKSVSQKPRKKSETEVQVPDVVVPARRSSRGKNKESGEGQAKAVVKPPQYAKVPRNNASNGMSTQSPKEAQNKPEAEPKKDVEPEKITPSRKRTHKESESDAIPPKVGKRTTQPTSSKDPETAAVSRRSARGMKQADLDLSKQVSTSLPDRKRGKLSLDQPRSGKRASRGPATSKSVPAKEPEKVIAKRKTARLNKDEALVEAESLEPKTTRRKTRITNAATLERRSARGKAKDEPIETPPKVVKQKSKDAPQPAKASPEISGASNKKPTKVAAKIGKRKPAALKEAPAEEAHSPPKRSRRQATMASEKLKDQAKNGQAAAKSVDKHSLDDSFSSTGSVRSPRNRPMKPVVMFTGYGDPQDMKLVTELGGKLTSQSSECTVLVTEKIKRTAKFLSSLGKGIPIVSPAWLAQSRVTKTFLDPWKYIVQDKESERKWGFQLHKALSNASKTKLLNGFQVFATAKCLPTPQEIKDIVTCAGGQYLDKMPTKKDDRTFVISCPEDKKSIVKAAKAGISICDKEILLTGLFKQKLDFHAHKMNM